MKKQISPIAKLEADIQDYSAILVHARLELKTAKEREQVFLTQRISNRIEYYERRLAVSKTELTRLRKLYDMPCESQLIARLIPANQFQSETVK